MDHSIAKICSLRASCEGKWHGRADRLTRRESRHWTTKTASASQRRHSRATRPNHPARCSILGSRVKVSGAIKSAPQWPDHTHKSASRTLIGTRIQLQGGRNASDRHGIQQGVRREESNCRLRNVPWISGIHLNATATARNAPSRGPMPQGRHRASIVGGKVSQLSASPRLRTEGGAMVLFSPQITKGRMDTSCRDFSHGSLTTRKLVMRRRRGRK